MYQLKEIKNKLRYYKNVIDFAIFFFLSFFNITLFKLKKKEKLKLKERIERRIGTRKGEG